MTGNGCKVLEMAGMSCMAKNAWICLEIPGNDWDDWEMLEWSDNSWKLLEISRNGWNCWIWKTMA